MRGKIGAVRLKRCGAILCVPTDFGHLNVTIPNSVGILRLAKCLAEGTLMTIFFSTAMMPPPPPPPPPIEC